MFVYFVDLDIHDYCPSVSIELNFLLRLSFSNKSFNKTLSNKSRASN